MIGFFQFRAINQVLSKLASFSLIAVLVIRCSESSNETVISKSKKRVGEFEYEQIYFQLRDSLENWKLNNLWATIITYDFFLDSAICFNNEGNRIVASVHIFGNQNNSKQDGLQQFYGEKIDGLWYFFPGAYTVLPRELFRENVKDPLTYQELHAASVKYIFSPYLSLNDENWFTSHFEGSGWGDLNTQHFNDWCFKGKRYTDLKEYYKAVHICAAKSIWRDRDTSKPIVPLKKDSLSASSAGLP